MRVHELKGDMPGKRARDVAGLRKHTVILTGTAPRRSAMRFNILFRCTGEDGARRV